MKNLISKIAILFLILTMFTSCEVIGDIFQAGLVVGIVIVILVIGLIVWIFSKFKK